MTTEIDLRLSGTLVLPRDAPPSPAPMNLPVKMPEDFGAKGDGVTDDVTAIQAWLDAIGGYAFFGLMPGGATYRVSDKVVVRPGVTIWGYGATIKAADGAALGAGVYTQDLTATAGSNGIAIYGLTVDGNRANRTLPGSGANYYVYSSADVRLQDCVSIGAVSDGFYVGGLNSDAYPLHRLSTRVVLEDCRSDHAHRNGLSAVGVDGLRIIGGDYSNSAGAPPNAGIDVEPNGAGTQCKGIRIRDVRVAGNGYHGIIVQGGGNTFDVVVESIRAIGNAGYGVYQTATAGPTVVRDVFGSGNASGLIGSG